MERRDFIKKAGLTGIGALALGCNNNEAKSDNSPSINKNKKYKWKMVTTWPPHFPVLGEGADKFAEWVKELSDGRLEIQVYGGGELVPPLEAFEAVSQGIAEMGHGVSYYWAGKSPAAQFFGAVPFGMNAQQINSWLYSGGGLELWEELYADFNLIPMPAGNTGVQMGGWFNREINTIDDFKGLKMRIPGLGGKAISKAGGAAVLVAGGELYTSLERGVVDAAEWIGPYHDYIMGFHKIAKYYYYPGWQEPGATLEAFVNKSKFESLPKDLQMVLKTAAYRSNMWMLSEFETKNALYLNKLVKEENVKLKRFSDDILKKLKGYSQESINEIIEKDSHSKKIYESYSKFSKSISMWSKLSEKEYYSSIN